MNGSCCWRQEGATNLVTGIANAFWDSVPMAIATGNIAVPLLGRDSFQAKKRGNAEARLRVDKKWGGLEFVTPIWRFINLSNIVL